MSSIASFIALRLCAAARFRWVVVALAILLPGVAAGAPQAPLVGAWKAQEYVLRDGPVHRVDGLIFFSAGDWTVLFFVVDDGGDPLRGSAEGGTYVLDGDRLTFRHRYNAAGGVAVDGLPASEWSMSIRAAGEEPAEPCRITIDGDRLAIHFPSGNRMTFARSSGPGASR